MDPALIREREKFKKQAAATSLVDTKKRKEPPAKNDHAPKKRSTAAPKPIDIDNYKYMAGSSQYKFSVLAKIVKHMKCRHQEGDTHPLSCEEILDETNQLDVGAKIKQWLANDSLKSNPKLEEVDGRYRFKPPYMLKDRKALLKLLKMHDLRGLGGIPLDDILESVPKAEKVLKQLENDIIYVNRPIDKKKMLFYNDKMCKFEVDEEYQKLWRGIAMEGLDDAKIESYLNKQGITSMRDQGLKKVVPMKKRRGGKRKGVKTLRENEHLAGILKTYDDG